MCRREIHTDDLMCVQVNSCVTDEYTDELMCVYR